MENARQEFRAKVPNTPGTGKFEKLENWKIGKKKLLRITLQNAKPSQPRQNPRSTHVIRVRQCPSPRAPELGLSARFSFAEFEFEARE